MAAADFSIELGSQTSSERGRDASFVSWGGSARREEKDEEELRWAAIQRLPTIQRMRKGILQRMTSGGRVVPQEVKVVKLGNQEKKLLMESMLRLVQDGNENFLRKLRNRTDRVGIEIPKVEVRFQHLCVEGDAYVGQRSLPTLLNSTLNAVEGVLGTIGLSPSKKRVTKILQDANGIIEPSRMKLLLGPPGSGKTMLLKALAGKLNKDLRVSGKVTYCGHELSEFVPERTCAYISQHDLHYAKMTIRETLDFAGQCLGVGARYDQLSQLLRLEKEAGIKPDLEIDAFMKAVAQENNLITEYVLKILGLDICADTVLGDQMIRGVSGGQRKRATTGEMLVGPAKVFLMDEISTGLDSSTTFQIVKFLRQMVHIMDVTTMVSLLQPEPETFNLFDDIILLSEGQIVYQGPRENVLQFFENMGFKCPERKGVADFLLEVTSKKDQKQYWFRENQPYKYVSVSEFVGAFNSFHVGQQLSEKLRIPFDKSKTHPAALVREKYGMSNWKLFQACFAREWLLMKRDSFVHIFKIFKMIIVAIITFTVFLRTEMKAGQRKEATKFLGAMFYSVFSVMFNGTAEVVMTVSRLPVFYKQRDFLFYPSWAFGLPIWLTRIPISLIETGIWTILTYYTIGFAPAPSRFFKHFLALFGIHNMAASLYRLVAAVGRVQIVATKLAFFVMLMVLLFGGFIVSPNDIRPWMIWGLYTSPLMYGQNAIAINEFLDDRWSTATSNPHEPTVGISILKGRGMFTTEYWYWICIGALIGFSVLFNALFIAALACLKPPGNIKAVIVDNNSGIEEIQHFASNQKDGTMAIRNDQCNNGTRTDARHSQSNKETVLPFQPLSLAFSHVNYYVDMPAKMKNHGVEKRQLQLLKDVSSTFRPGILTALVGVSGAGKTTLMDVLAGRKTVGHIEGNISISGYPKNQVTFARICGYCEQYDIHSPYVTIHESLLYSAWLRLATDVNEQTRKIFVEEVMELVELNQLRNAMVGSPRVDGLSTEQRKRLTIAVEMVANPSIIFMDEPTSGLDARAAAIVMRTVKNTVNTGRTVVCTIHQPSIDVFESFDELLLMKRGGQVIYAGPLGHHSHKLVEYFENIPGVPKITHGYNPAAWVLEVSSNAVETQLGIDFANIYANSDLYRRNQEHIKELSSPQPGSKDLHFPTQYSQNFITQCAACFWKQNKSYWRNPKLNVIRFLMTIAIAISFGSVFWNKGDQIHKEQDLLNILGATYVAVVFPGTSISAAIQPVVSMERIVFYRERASRMYSELPYAFAQVASEIIYVAIQAIGYVSILYSMIGFEWKVDKLLYFYYFVFMSFSYNAMYGMMISAITPNLQVGSILLSLFFSLWSLFSGFLIPKPFIPVWWRWYYWVCPVSWTLYGLVTSQYGDRMTPLEIPGSEEPVRLKAFLLNVLGFDGDFLLPVLLAHVGWVLLFFFVFAYSIKFLNFQRR